MEDAGGRSSALRALRTLDVEVALRAAIAVVVPLTVLAVIGRLDWAAYAAFGAMTAIFGRRERYRMRLRTVPTAAAGLLVSVAIGTLLAAFDAPAWLEAIALVGVLVGGILVVAVVRLGPPTPLFFVFGLLVCASVPTEPGQVPERLGVAVVSAAFALLLSLSGYTVRRAASGRAAEEALKALGPLRPVRVDAVRERAVWVNIGQNVVAALAAGAVALTFGIGHPYWAVVGAVAVIPPPGAAHSLSRAWHRVFGTLGGVAITGLVLWPDPPIAVLIAVIGVAQFGAEVLVARHYGLALLFITPLALVVAHLAGPVAVGTLLADRVLETVVGCAIGMLAVLAARATDARSASTSIP